MDSELPGFRIPFHRSLTEPILMGGAPRGLAILNATMAMAMVMSLNNFFALPVAIIVHMMASFGAKKDPMFFEVFTRHVKEKDCYYL